MTVSAYSHMNYSYELLTRADTEKLKALLKVFGEAFNERSTYHDAVPSDEYLRNLLTKDTFIVLTARHGTEIVGGLAAYVLEKFERERSEVYIYDLAVSEAHRRRKIATNLILELKKIAKERGAYVIFVQADPGDDPAIKLYESLGTREDVHHFDISVD